jgi:protease-4
VISLIVRLVWLLAWLLALPLRLLRRLRTRTRVGTYVVVEVDGPVTEIPERPRFWPPRTKRRLSLHALQRLLDVATKDRRVAGVVLVLKNFRGGTATATSLRQLLTRWRAAGKSTVVHLPLGGGTRETYVAAAAGRVLLGPQATLAPLGFLSATRYVRGALDRIGVVPEVTARGRYKTAAERIERPTMSEAQREQMDALLDTVHAEVTSAIAVGRRIDVVAARALIDGAPYGGAEAVTAGLVDALAYDDELALRVAQGGDTSASSAEPAKAHLVPAAAWLGPRAALRPAALRSRGVLAIVTVHGAITGDSGLPFQTLSVDERVIAAVRVARLNPAVRGVMLHIDSPGGSALASDRMHHELAALAAEKPLVACMGDVAASGGYYVAAAAHAIVAQPTTLTGSIGVIGARVALEPLFARIGVVTEVLSRGAHARLLDPFLPLSDDDRAALEREIDRFYQAFLKVVADGRKRSVDEIHTLAQGRVWMGLDAHSRGLVDHLGGFEDALKLLRTRVGRGAERLRIVTLRAPGRALPPLEPPERKTARAVAHALEAIGPVAGVDPSWISLCSERVLALDPVAAGLDV